MHMEDEDIYEFRVGQYMSWHGRIGESGEGIAGRQLTMDRF